jgi:alkyl hydroperoxide reductase subunit AhpC
VYSHQAYAKHLGGITFPLLADFHPRGEVTRRYGLWREDKGFGRRAIFVIDTQGIVRWSKVYLSGPPEYDEVFAAIEAIAR